MTCDNIQLKGSKLDVDKAGGGFQTPAGPDLTKKGRVGAGSYLYQVIETMLSVSRRSLKWKLESGGTGRRGRDTAKITRSYLGWGTKDSLRSALCQMSLRASSPVTFMTAL